jgi:hypothetical protein
MKLNKLSIKDKPIFKRYLSLSEHNLSVYAFENIYLWKGLYDIYWTIIADSLCVFFKDKIGGFLYLSPLARKIRPAAIQEVFKIMDGFNQNKSVSRIENVEEKEISFYQHLGYCCSYKSADYLCKRQDLVRLKGNKFKSFRASVNYFLKHYTFKYLPFSLKHRNACLELYHLWMQERKSKFVKDLLYQSMLEDSLNCLKILLKDYSNLDCIGKQVIVDGRLKAFTFGFKLNAKTFCILYEIVDLSIKGLAQFIFRQFCAELKDYQYINTMDDSGLENLKKVKLAYHPIRLIPTYIITRKNE